MLPWWDWLAWIAAVAVSFGVLQGLAVSGRGPTLSSRVRRFFGTDSRDARRRRLGVVALAAAVYGFAAWFIPHIAGG